MNSGDSSLSKFRELECAPERIFAIGDIHGCSQELGVLLEHLVVKEQIGERDLVVFIGDYIDRGSDSQGVIELLLGAQSEFEQVVFLKGNHEDMLLNFLGYEGHMGEVYLYNGGKDFFLSYGVKPKDLQGDLLDTVPKTHLSFLLNLESYVGVGKYIFVHAGLDPMRRLGSQLDSDLFWIRDAFIAHEHDFDRTVVFGHTPYHEVMFDEPYKIGIDTGLVYGNKLTCIELSERRLIQIDHGERNLKERHFPA